MISESKYFGVLVAATLIVLGLGIVSDGYLLVVYFLASVLVGFSTAKLHNNFLEKKKELEGVEKE